MLGRGREAFAQRRWSEAYALLAEAERGSPLAAVDLDHLATAAYLKDDEAAAIAAWQRAHHAWLDDGEVERAARAGFWVGLVALMSGGLSQTTGWLARVQRLLGESGAHALEHGYLDVLLGLLTMGKGDGGRAAEIFARAISCAGSFDEADLMAMALLGRGQAIIHDGHVVQGISSLDEAMVSVTAGEVSPIVAGMVYCGVIGNCERVFDSARAREWTTALDAWCASQPGMVAFRTQCLVHRSEIMLLRGAWSSALDEARRACERVTSGARRIAGRALYQRGEVHRLRGELDEADARYRECAHQGHAPEPGASLLRLARGDIDAAATMIQVALAEVGEQTGPPPASTRVKLLLPCVEILLAAREDEAATRAADELADHAAALGATLLQAAAAKARGAVLLHGGDARAALGALRRSWALWQQLEAPYEAARARELIGEACRQLGDCQAAELHLDAARSVFRRLGAATELARLEGAPARARRTEASSLTSREREVLKLVATGKTNRQIAAVLALSEHTIARHLSNIFNKLGVTSRTAASAYAFEHQLV